MAEQSEIARLEGKIDKLLIMMIELIRSQANVETNTEDLIEKVNNISLSGDGFSYAHGD